MAGRFERLSLTHWSARALSVAFALPPAEAAVALVQTGSYPGAFPLRADPARGRAYVRDAIVEPAIGRDLMALTSIRRPALLRQIFAVAAGMPAQIVSLQKLQGQLGDPGALETVAQYLSLLSDAYLVAPLEKFSERVIRRRRAPPKLVTLNNALIK
jgi:predicted AAA+ superfamily ATPase